MNEYKITINLSEKYLGNINNKEIIYINSDLNEKEISNKILDALTDNDKNHIK